MFYITKFTLQFFMMLLAAVSQFALADQVKEPTNYKMDNYRSPTPATLKGTLVVDAAKAKELYDSGEVIFIDVLPAPKRPQTLTDDEIWLPPERLNIPNSTWLADVGYGVLSDELENYFKSNLTKLAESKTKSLLFYCKANCWMSWNAAKRALGYGFTNIFWFPGGTDDWLSAGFELEQSKPLSK